MFIGYVVNMKKPIKIKTLEENAGKAEAILKLLANKNRLMILCYIIEGGKSVGEIVDYVGLSQSAVSQHLAKMREQGIVSTDKKGQTVYYRIIDKDVEAILATLHTLYCE